MSMFTRLLFHAQSEIVARGKTRITERCRTCDTIYTYEILRTASVFVSEFGRISTKQHNQACAQAESLLARKFEVEFDAVPCPWCGDYQPDAIPLAKAQRYAYLHKNQLLLFLISIVTLAASAFIILVYTLATHSLRDNANPNEGIFILVIALLVCWSPPVAWLSRYWAYKAWTREYNPNDTATRDDRLDIANDRLIGRCLTAKQRARAKQAKDHREQRRNH